MPHQAALFPLVHAPPRTWHALLACDDPKALALEQLGDLPRLQEMQDMVALCLEKDPAKRPSAEQLLKHRFFRWVKPPKDALEELLNGVPGPVQRLSSLTRRSTENTLAAAADEMASYQPDERVSLKTQKVPPPPPNSSTKCAPLELMCSSLCEACGTGSQTCQL